MRDAAGAVGEEQPAEVTAENGDARDETQQVSFSEEQEPAVQVAGPPPPRNLLDWLSSFFSSLLFFWRE